ncbi:MAG: M23 family metallopeptidase [Pseudomonadota bacterium]
MRIWLAIVVGFCATAGLFGSGQRVDAALDKARPLATASIGRCVRKLCISMKRQGRAVRVYARNPYEAQTLSVKFKVKLKNMWVEGADPRLAFVVAPRTRRRHLFTLRAGDGRWSYHYRFHWTMGHFDAEHDDKVTYSLPYRDSSRARVTQSCNGDFSHRGKRNYAVDFAMRIGTPVYAARAGTVASVREDSDENGTDRSFARKDNNIVIEHDDRTHATYAHLRRGGVVVRPGQRVQRGQLIGYSGNTGWSTGPHLHFEVFKPDAQGHQQSLPVTFETLDGPVRCPVSGARLRRGF